MNKNNQITVPLRNDKVLEVELSDSLIVYDTSTNQGHCLNPIAVLVWKSCDGQARVSDIERIVEEKYSIQEAESLVLFILDSLRKKRLLKEGAHTCSFPLISRRDIVRKYVPAALVLPFVISATAPTRAQLISVSVPSPAPPSSSGNLPEPLTEIRIEGGNLPLFTFSGAAISFLLVGLARRKRRRNTLPDAPLNNDSSEVKWLIEGEHDANMPISYGVVPRGMNAVFSAEPLVEGELYFVQTKIDADASSIVRHFRIENGQVVEVQP
jgi:hypothetical protein